MQKQTSLWEAFDENLFFFVLIYYYHIMQMHWHKRYSKFYLKGTDTHYSTLHNVDNDFKVDIGE
jgi:hypothetical protein